MKRWCCATAGSEKIPSQIPDSFDDREMKKAVNGREESGRKTAVLVEIAVDSLVPWS